MAPLDDSGYHYMAGEQMTYLDIVRAWLAFKELRQRDAVIVGFCSDGRDLARADAAGWDLGFRPRTRERRYLERMHSDPHAFFRGYEWGVDVLYGDSNGCVVPRKFCSLLDEVRATSGHGPHVYPESGVARGVERLARAFKDERLRSEASQQSVAEQPQRTYRTSPFLLPSPIAAFLREYGIDGGRVYVRESALRAGQSAPVAAITDVRHTGGMFVGDVVFRDATSDVVTWANVFQPEKTAREADRIVEAIKRAESNTTHSGSQVTPTKALPESAVESRSGMSVADELTKLAELHKLGMLSAEEFVRAKQRLLGS